MEEAYPRKDQGVAKGKDCQGLGDHGREDCRGKGKETLGEIGATGAREEAVGLDRYERSKCLYIEHNQMDGIRTSHSIYPAGGYVYSNELETSPEPSGSYSTVHTVDFCVRRDGLCKIGVGV